MKKILLLFLSIFQELKSCRIQFLSGTLTYYTLLSIVPMIALFISLAETFHITPIVENTIANIFEEQQEVVAYLAKFAQNAINEVNKLSFKLFGIILLFWAGIKMLLYIDIGINQLWDNPPKPKFLKRKLRFIVILISTFALFFLSTIWSFFLTVTLNFFQKQAILKPVAEWLVYLSNLLPSFLQIILLSFLYYYVPYVKIKISSAIVSGVIISIGYQIFQVLYFAVQIFVSKYNTVYGAFAALPLFLVWVHLSWLIFFIGAKLCEALNTVNDNVS